MYYRGTGNEMTIACVLVKPHADRKLYNERARPGGGGGNNTTNAILQIP